MMIDRVIVESRGVIWNAEQDSKVLASRYNNWRTLLFRYNITLGNRSLQRKKKSAAERVRGGFRSTSRSSKKGEKKSRGAVRCCGSFEKDEGRGEKRENEEIGRCGLSKRLSEF